MRASPPNMHGMRPMHQRALACHGCSHWNVDMAAIMKETRRPRGLWQVGQERCPNHAHAQSDESTRYLIAHNQKIVFLVPLEPLPNGACHLHIKQSRTELCMIAQHWCKGFLCALAHISSKPKMSTELACVFVHSPHALSSCLPCPNEHRPTSLHVQCSTLSALATSVSALCPHIRHDCLGYSFASLTDLIDPGGLLMFLVN